MRTATGRCGWPRPSASTATTARDRFEYLGIDGPNYPVDGLPHENTYALHETRDGSMWVGTWGGLARYDADAGRFIAYEHDPDDPTSLSRNQMWAIEEARDGALWTGTDGGGLNRLDRATGRFVRYRHDPTDSTTLAHDRIHDVHEAADGTLWIATSGGLSRLDRSSGTFHHLTARDGLPSNLIRGLFESAGDLWIVTAGGLARLDAETKTIHTYGVQDGLPVSSFSHVAMTRTADGTLWLGSDVGVTAFQPEALDRPPHAPPVVLTDIRVAGRPRSERLPAAIHEVRMPPGADFVSFTFAALAFTAPERLRYAYQLEGLEDDWIYSEQRRQATYAHLAPGTYTFRVRAAGPSGVWTSGTEVRLVVEPHLWQLAWVQILGALLVVGAVGGGYRWRLHHLLKLERTRSRIANDLHDEVASKLSTVALMIDLSSRASRLPDADQGRLRQAATMARSLVDDIRDTVWVIDAGNDGLDTLIERLEHTAHQMLQGLHHRVALPEDVPDLDLGFDTRRHVLLLTKEALHNTLRHARATHVDLEIDATEEELSLTVRDDGVGFDADTVQAGRGLQLMCKRADELGATLRIESQPGVGTELSLIVPLR